MGAPVEHVGLVIVMFPHGASKAFGWFGSEGLQATVNGMTERGLPVFVPVLVPVFVVLAGLVGSVALLVGFFGRLAAASIAMVMLGAVALVHFERGFFLRGPVSGSGDRAVP